MSTMIDRTTMQEQIRDFVRERFLFGTDDDGLVDTNSFVESGVVDSTGIMELVAWIEETFNFTLDDAELIPDNLDSVDRVEAFIARKLELAGAASEMHSS